jgi:hypothetical protein
MKSELLPSSHVRFTAEEYAIIKRDELLTGKSIPWLLKTTYFKNGIAPPTLDVESRRSIRRELASIGNNVNQLARNVNSGLISNIKEEVREILHAFRIVKSFLGLDYGDRKNSV